MPFEQRSSCCDMTLQHDYTDQTMFEILVSCLTIFSREKTSDCNDNCRISLKTGDFI